MSTGKRLSAVAAVAIAAALVPGIPAQAATTAAAGTFIKLGHSDKCLNVQSGSTANSAKIVQYPCSTTATNDKFKLVPKGDGYYWIQAVGSGKCLNIPNGSLDAKTGVIQYTCNNTAENNLWAIEEEVGRASYRIWAKHSGLCLNLDGGSTTSNIQLIQYPCSANSRTSLNEQFYFPPATSAKAVARPVTKAQPVAVIQTSATNPQAPEAVYYSWVGPVEPGGQSILHWYMEPDPDWTTTDPARPQHIVDPSTTYTGRSYLGTRESGLVQSVAHTAATGDAVVSTEMKDDEGDLTFELPWILGGAFDAQPAIAPLKTGGALASFAIINGALWYSPQVAGDTQTAYGAWRSLGGTGLTGTPAFVPTATGVRVIARTTGGLLQNATLTGTTLSDWTALTGSGFSGNPSVTTDATGRTHLVARSGSGIAYSIAGGAATTLDTPVAPAGDASVIVDKDTQYAYVTYRGTDGNVYAVVIDPAGVQVSLAQINGTDDPEKLAAGDPTGFTFTLEDGASAIGFAYPGSDEMNSPWWAKYTNAALIPVPGAKNGKVLKAAPKAEVGHATDAKATPLSKKDGKRLAPSGVR
jgi:hypothetical protein